MNTCKYCNSGISDNGNFCSNCGFINFKDTDSIFKRLLTQLKYIFINPVAFIRNSKLVNPIFTGTMAIIIILFEIIILKLGLKISPLSTILGTFIIIIIETLFMFSISKFIFKKDINFLSFINLSLAIQIISTILNLFGALLGYILGPIFFVIISILTIFITVLLMYQGLKDILNSNIKVALLTLIGTFSGTTLLVFIILKMLLKNALTSIF